METGAISVSENASPQATVQFIRDLQRFSEQLARDHREIQTGMTQIQAASAAQALEKAEALSDDDFYLAAKLGMSAQVSQIPSSAPELQQRIGSLVLRQLQVGLANGLELDEVRNAIRAADYFERHGEPALAIEMSQAYASLIARAENPRYQATINALHGMNRRLSLLGQPWQLEGTTLDGRKLQTTDFRDQVVLVHFWASTNLPSLAEIPQLKDYATQYRDQGFRIVGVTLDQDRAVAEAVVAKEQIPWPSLFPSAEDATASLVERYGVDQLPVSFLIDQQGQVVSTQARGPQLQRWLFRLLGPKSYVARQYAIQRRWSDAEAELQRLLVKQPDRVDYRVALGAIQLLGDDTLGYAGTCQTSWPIVLRQSQQDQARAIPLFCLAASSSVDAREVYELAQAIRAETDSPAARLAVILASFRFGLDDVCLNEQLSEADAFSMSVASLTHAMAASRSGQSERAEDLLNQGRNLVMFHLNDRLAPESSGTPYEHWVECTVARLFLDEAKASVAAE